MEVKEVLMSDIRGAAFPIRTETRDGDPELRASIKAVGLMQPILLRSAKTRGYEVVAGLRRFEACKELRFKTIAAVIERLDDKTAFEIMLAENIQRKQLSAVEEAKAFRDYLDKYQESIRNLAAKINKSHSYIVQRLFLIDWMNELPARAREEIKKDLGTSGSQITASHLEEVTKIKEPEKVKQVIQAIKDERLTSSQTSEVVHLVRERDMPVKNAVQNVKVVERARDAASHVVDRLRDAMIETGKQVRDVESSEQRRLMENYMFLGTIIQSLKDGKIFSLDASDKSNNMLVWQKSRMPITETHQRLQRRLGIAR